LGIGYWGFGIVDWAQSPIPNPQSPIPNPQSPIPIYKPILLFFFYKILIKNNGGHRGYLKIFGQTTEQKIELRNNKIKIILQNKRNPPTYKNVQNNTQELLSQEEKEDIEKNHEDQVVKSHLDLSKHRKKHKKKKKCWICKSPIT